MGKCYLNTRTRFRSLPHTYEKQEIKTELDDHTYIPVIPAQNKLHLWTVECLCSMCDPQCFMNHWCDSDLPLQHFWAGAARSKVQGYLGSSWLWGQLEYLKYVKKEKDRGCAPLTFSLCSPLSLSHLWSPSPCSQPWTELPGHLLWPSVYFETRGASHAWGQSGSLRCVCGVPFHLYIVFVIFDTSGACLSLSPWHT